MQPEPFLVTSDPLDAAEITDLVRREHAGAIALFFGVVRNHNDGKPVHHLEYEAHESMALRKLEEAGRAALELYPELAAAACWHRIGRLEIGETSLLVAVSSAHRELAFRACQWTVDLIKETVPVWKKEYGPDGAVWLEGHAIEPPA